MRGFNAGKGTGLTQDKSKSGGGSKDARPQKAPNKATGSAMKMGMRSNAMAGRDPNMAMKTSNAMMPGSMMAMKANRSAMTLKDDVKEAAIKGAMMGSVENKKLERAMSKSTAKGEDRKTTKENKRLERAMSKSTAKRFTDKKAARENRRMEREMSKSTAKGEDRTTRRESAKADRAIRKAGESKAQSPMSLQEGERGKFKREYLSKQSNRKWVNPSEPGGVYDQMREKKEGARDQTKTRNKAQEERRKELKSQGGVKKRSVYPGKQRPMSFKEIGRR